MELKTISCDIVSVACDSVALPSATFDPFKSTDINTFKQEGTDKIWQLLGKSHESGTQAREIFRVSQSLLLSPKLERRIHNHVSITLL